jgi:cytoskeleton protein RodZ
VESFGARLKREREQQKVTLEDIALSTKIGTRFLRALEEEHFDQLPGGIFNKGFVRAYARHLGMDEGQAISDYLAASGTGQPEKKPEEVREAREVAVRPEDTSEVAARIPWGIFAIVLLLVALGFAAWGFLSREKSVRPAVVPPPPATSKTPPATPPKTEARKTASSEPSTNVMAASPKPTEAATVPPGPTPTPGAFVVLVTAREDSWLTITADGKQVMQDTLTAPAAKSVEAMKEIVIRAGNVGALEFSFNGKKVPVRGDFDEVKTLVFDATGLQPEPAKTQPPTAQTPQ